MIYYMCQYSFCHATILYHTLMLHCVTILILAAIPPWTNTISYTLSTACHLWIVSSYGSSEVRSLGWGTRPGRPSPIYTACSWANRKLTDPCGRLPASTTSTTSTTSLVFSACVCVRAKSYHPMAGSLLDQNTLGCIVSGTWKQP